MVSRPPARLPACLPSCPPACLPACPPVCLPARLPACLSACGPRPPGSCDGASDSGPSRKFLVRVQARGCCSSETPLALKCEVRATGVRFRYLVTVQFSSLDVAESAMDALMTQAGVADLTYVSLSAGAGRS
eukprot:350792-Chlamydomonas_euryale.AAC.11